MKQQGWQFKLDIYGLVFRHNLECPAAMSGGRECALQQMNSEIQIREQFLKSEASVGITRDAFTRRFLYSGDPASDNYLLERYSPTPSQLQGLSIEQEKGIGYLMGEMIFRAGESLRLPVSTTVVATCIAHYFYSRMGMLDHDFRDVALGATFLACKSEETLRKSYEVSTVFDHVFKVFEGQRMPIKGQVLNSPEYEYMRKKVIQMENEILFALGFEVYRLFDIPHRYIGGLFKTFDRHPDSKRICQRAWTYLNDFYRTNCSLYYPGPTIAAAALYLALLKLGIKMPTAPWWVLLEAQLESIEELAGQLEAFYEAAGAHKYSLEWAAAQLNELGDRHQLVNVFPVNYYRKIMLDTNSQLKIKKIAIEPPQPLPQIQAQPQPTTIQTNNGRQKESQSRSRSRQQRKKKKEKSKKEKKDKKKKKDRRKYSGDSKSSKSSQRNKHKRKSSSEESDQPEQQIRNNDQTPKINKPEQSVPEPMIEEKRVQAEPVKQMQVVNAKGLLSMISDQLKRHQIKKQKQESTVMEVEPKAKPENQSGDDSDEQLLAELIQIRKSKGMKGGNPSEE